MHLNVWWTLQTESFFLLLWKAFYFSLKTCWKCIICMNTHFSPLVIYTPKYLVQFLQLCKYKWSCYYIIIIIIINYYYYYYYYLNRFFASCLSQCCLLHELKLKSWGFSVKQLHSHYLFSLHSSKIFSWYLRIAGACLCIRGQNLF